EATPAAAGGAVRVEHLAGGRHLLNLAADHLPLFIRGLDLGFDVVESGPAEAAGSKAAGRPAWEAARRCAGTTRTTRKPAGPAAGRPKPGKWVVRHLLHRFLLFRCQDLGQLGVHFLLQLLELLLLLGGE